MWLSVADLYVCLKLGFHVIDLQTIYQLFNNLNSCAAGDVE